jgi:asparagine synthase (glutamine-hydrolysing)
LWRLLCDAVDATAADAVALSGGVDSAGLLAAVREVRGRAHAFVLRAAHVPVSDIRAAHRCARGARAEVTEIGVGLEELPARFPETVRAAGELVFNGGAVARDLFLGRVREAGCTALLSGTGADEIFLGNPEALRTLGRRRRAEREAWTPVLLRPLPRPSALPRAMRARQDHVLRHELPVRSLPPEQGASRAAGLRLKTPYLAPALAGWAARLPTARLVRGALGKRVLREALAGHVPADVLQAPKTAVLAPAGLAWGDHLSPCLRGPQPQGVDPEALARAVELWPAALEPVLLRLASWSVLCEQATREVRWPA